MSCAAFTRLHALMSGPCCRLPLLPLLPLLQCFIRVYCIHLRSPSMICRGARGWCNSRKKRAIAALVRPQLQQLVLAQSGHHTGGRWLQA